SPLLPFFFQISICLSASLLLLSQVTNTGRKGHKTTIPLINVFLFSDAKCVFPFFYKGSLYFDCTLHDSHYYWCSLTTHFVNRWKYCRNTDYAKCALPFVFRGKEYKSCTKEGSILGKYWCSITPNHDQDRAWRYC
uniref:Fibronectin type-II domain-containing protein n=1 Tax=Catagonus wagneri TaxID=51154 RepID=A0A8C3W0N2_9CETA